VDLLRTARKRPVSNFGKREPGFNYFGDVRVFLKTTRSKEAIKTGRGGTQGAAVRLGLASSIGNGLTREADRED